MNKYLRKIRKKYTSLKFKTKSVRFNLLFLSVLIVASIIYLYIITPKSLKVNSPVIVTYSDCDSLSDLYIEILDRKKLKILTNFDISNNPNWTSVMIQASENCVNPEVEIGGKKLSNYVKKNEEILRDGNYYKFTNQQFKKYFNNANPEYITMSYETKEGIYRKNYDKYFLSIIYIPTNKSSKNYPVEIQVLSPESFLLSSSIPNAERTFMLNYGVTYSFKTINERSGLLVIFDDLSSGAIKEIIVLITTTILGFITGMIIEKKYNKYL